MFKLCENRARRARFLRDIWATFGVWVSKLQANVATRHDIFVSFFQANVSGKVATSVPRAKERRRKEAAAAAANPPSLTELILKVLPAFAARGQREFYRSMLRSAVEKADAAKPKRSAALSLARSLEDVRHHYRPGAPLAAAAHRRRGRASPLNPLPILADLTS